VNHAEVLGSLLLTAVTVFVATQKLQLWIFWRPYFVHLFSRLPFTSPMRHAICWNNRDANFKNEFCNRTNIDFVKV